MKKFLPVGKLDSDILQRVVFNNIKYKRPEVLTGPGIGEDCAALDFGEFECITSTDPITASVKDIGRLSIHISCNDIASNGVQPVAILLTALLPVGTTEEDIETIMKQAAEAAEASKVQIAGGHTEITKAVNQPVICSTAFGRAPKGGSQSAQMMKPGDLLFVTKVLAMEGTGIIASEKGEALVEKGVISQEEFEDAKAMLDHVSVVEEGVLAGEIGTHGMHDITEGGVLGGVWEMCKIAGCGAMLYEDNMPRADVTKKLAKYYSFNTLRMISSGSMLIAMAPEKKDELKKAMAEAGIAISCIGEITGPGEKVIMQMKDGSTEEVDPPAADEIYKVIGR